MSRSKSPSFWRDRPVLVTGATGLVGSWLVKRLLDAGAQVVCLVRDWVPGSDLVTSHAIDRTTVVRGELEDLAFLERVLGEYEIDTVMHLAAQTIVPIANANPLSTFESNVRGTWLLMEACRRSPRVKQIVVASSDKAYGDQKKLPYNESTPLQGRNPYDASKSCADLIAQSYAATYKLPVVITRCGNFFGGGDVNWNRLVPGVVRSLLRNERPVIRSDGTCIRDYLYVEDGAAGYLLAAERLAQKPALKGNAFNLSYGEPLTVLEMISRITTVMKSPLKPIVRNEADHEIQAQYLDAGKARKILGWTPQFDLEQGLKKTIAWYRAFFAQER
ncbi:MAG: GDP-mannose 4,6-dehydratase [Candidatus Peribacteraceae bacterium]|nr:GDP-mannose 4,6-dehydratase [Candidatus Peribacteraceae bacterium]MDD5741998.1 GDP-mannose 4,6-dehydratase [Candidatus Peribacteraceae bacterium]